MSSIRAGALAAVLSVLALSGCGGGDSSDSSSSDATSAPTPAAPTAIATPVPGTDFPIIYAGRKYKLIESMTDEEWAKSLALARATATRESIQMAYDQPTYVSHKLNDAPMYLVVDQDTVAMIEGPQFETPITCTLDDGSTVYATDLEE